MVLMEKKNQIKINLERKVYHLMEDNILNDINWKKKIQQVNNVGVNRWKNFIEIR